MKKQVSILLMSIFLMTACTGDEDQETPNDNTNQEETPDEGDNVTNDEEENQVMMPEDGTYEGKGDPWEYGQEEARVVIIDGKIAEVHLARLDKEGNDVTEEYTGEEINGQQYPDLVSASEEMAQEMVNEQTYEVDVIAGATISSENWIVATRRALEDENEVAGEGQETEGTEENNE